MAKAHIRRSWTQSLQLWRKRLSCLSTNREGRPAPKQWLLPKLMRDESGQTLVLAAACMIALVGILGLSVDAGVLRYQKRQMQNAADAAALAGALEVSACGGTANCSAMQSAVQSSLTENGLTGSFLSNCSARTGTRLEITLNNPPCALSSDPNRNVSSFVEVVASEPVPTVFARVLNVNSVAILARAEANAPPPTCVFALDPSGSNAFVLNSGTTLSGNCGAMVESTSAQAVACTSATVTAPIIYLVGSGTASSCSFTSTLKFGARPPNPPDPLSSLPKPPVLACGAASSGPTYHGAPSALTLSGNATLYADAAYCGGITINNGATVTFQAGTYVLGTSSTAGGLAVDVGASVNGSGVTFYNYGASGAVTFTYTSFTSGGVNLTAPTSGIYSGILFFQDPRNTTQATLLGKSAWNTVLQGVYYFPTAKVLDTYSGSAAYNFLVAYDIGFLKSSSGGTGLSTFASNYSSLTNGSPVPGPGVSLVE